MFTKAELVCVDKDVSDARLFWEMHPVLLFSRLTNICDAHPSINNDNMATISPPTLIANVIALLYKYVGTANTYIQFHVFLYISREITASKYIVFTY